MIHLLEHNVQTYLRLCEALESSNKVALVQATGTGKSYIIGKYIENYSKHPLILVPSNAIGEQWRKLIPYAQINTYQSLYSYKCKEEYDTIVADEMHHLGAPIWKDGFDSVLHQNQKAKVIGATATNVRYLDNSRDIAQEVFDGNVVNGIDLAEAINKNVLPTFTYITAYCGSDDDYDEWKGKIENIKRPKEREEVSSRLEMCKKNQISIGQCLTENLLNGKHKIIVFLNGICEIEQANIMFSNIFPEAEFLSVDSNTSDKENKETLEKYQNSDAQITFLFAVDMLNEGVHLNGTDCVVMFRNTISPQVYLQQLGRALSSNKEYDPVIFDFACNRENLRVFKDGGNITNFVEHLNEKLPKKRKIILKTYCEDLQKVLDDISELSLNRFSKDEDEYIINNAKNKTAKEIGEWLGRTDVAIRQRAEILNVNLKSALVVDEKTKQFIEQHKNDMTIPEMSRVLGIKEVTLRRCAKQNNITVKKKFNFLTEDEKEFLLSNRELSYGELARLTGRSAGTVSSYLKKNGNGTRREVRKWTDSELTFLKQNADKPDSEIAEILGRSCGAIQQKRNLL